MLNLHGTILDEKIDWFKPPKKTKRKKKKELIKRRAHNLKNQGAKVQGMVQLKDSNLVQMSPNWLLGI
jgi:hypothetical protein